MMIHADKVPFNRYSNKHAYRWLNATALKCISDSIVAIPTSSSSAGQLIYIDLDLVEYKYNCSLSCCLTREDLSVCATSSIGDTYLGVITSSKKAVHPLCLRTHSLNDVDVELFCDDSVPSIAIVSDPVGLQSNGALIVGVVDASLCCLSQRIVEDRVSNPHGEHAEDVWQGRADESLGEVQQPVVYIHHQLRHPQSIILSQCDTVLITESYNSTTGLLKNQVVYPTPKLH